MPDPPPPSTLTDADLLRAYIADHSEDPFARLVARHAAFVHAVAVRQTAGDHALAEDVAQAVLIVLARRPRAALAAASLRGWLHATTCYAAANARRAATRRQRHEHAAIAMRTFAGGEAPSAAAAVTAADDLALVDQALGRLRPRDRDAVLLHHVDGRPLAEVGAALGVSGEAAKKRVQRAVARLRAILRARGVAFDARALAGLIPIQPLADATHLLPGGADGRAFVLAKKVILHMKLSAIKTAAMITAAVLLAGGGLVAVAQTAGTSVAPAAAPPVPAPAPVKIAISEAISVEVVGIRRVGEATWWAADGSPLAASPLPPGMVGAQALPMNIPNWTSCEIALRVNRRAGTPPAMINTDVVPYAPSGASVNSGVAVEDRRTLPGDPPGTHSSIQLIGVMGPAEAKSIDLRVSMPQGEAVVVEAIDPRGQVVGDAWPARLLARVQPRGVGGLYLSWSTPREQDGATRVEAFDNFPDQYASIVAIDGDGKEHASSYDGGGILSSMGASHSVTRVRFPTLPLARVARFEMRAVPFKVVRFQNVALAPGNSGDVPVAKSEDDDRQGGPADKAIEGLFEIPAGTLGEAIASIADAGGVRVEVEWTAFARYQPVAPGSRVAAIEMEQPTPATALRAVFEAAGGRDYTLVVSDDGATIRLVAGAYHAVRGDGRVYTPGRRQ